MKMAVKGKKIDLEFWKIATRKKPELSENYFLNHKLKSNQTKAMIIVWALINLIYRQIINDHFILYAYLHLETVVFKLFRECGFSSDRLLH
jgi:hypothetical protein